MIYLNSAPTLPQRKGVTSTKSLSHEKRNEISTVDGKNSKKNTGLSTNSNDINPVNGEDLPPPPLPRKPQIQDPLGATNHSPTKNEQSPIKYQNLDTKEFDSRKNFLASSSGDSSPPSSLSAESSNSEETTSLNNSNKYLGAIPKRKPQAVTSNQEDQLHGMAKHMRRNKTSK